MKKNRSKHTAFLCLLLVAALFFCGELSQYSVYAKSHQTEMNVDDIILRLSTNKASYGKEDTVQFGLEIENGSDYRIRSTEIQWKMSKGLATDGGEGLKTSLTSIVPGNKQKIEGVLIGDPEIYGRVVPVWFVELILTLDFLMIVSAVVAMVVIKGKDSRKKNALSVMVLMVLLTIGCVSGVSDTDVQALETEDVSDGQQTALPSQPASQQSSWIMTEERTVIVTLTFEYADEPVKIQAVLNLLLESYEE